MATDNGAASEQSSGPFLRVWDPFVRIFHWLVVAGFFVAYFTEDELLTVHVWAGYTVGALVALRILWGLVGPRHARFSDFLYGPVKIWTHLIGLVTFRAERYVGHSPAGGAMVLALLIGLAATVWTGLAFYAIEENAGPLTGLYARTASEATSRSEGPAGEEQENEDRTKDDRERREEAAEEVWKELHEVLANLILVLVILHVGGVALASIAHRENLVRAMITGRKRAED